MKRETYMLAIMTAIACIAIIAFAVVFRMVGLADNTVELPEPEYTTPDEVMMLRAEAPEVERDGLVTYQTFEDALAEAKAAVPNELAELAGRAVWGEAGGIQDYAQRAAVIWCACNRADAWDMDIGDVLTVDQFHGLAIRGEVPPQHVELARDVLAKWTLESEGWVDADRVLPERFLYFEGNGIVNLFSTEYGGGEYWHG